MFTTYYTNGDYSIRGLLLADGRVEIIEEYSDRQDSLGAFDQSRVSQTVFALLDDDLEF